MIFEVRRSRGGEIRAACVVGVAGCEFLGTVPPALLMEVEVGRRRRGSTAGDSDHHGLKQWLEGPTAGQVETNATRSLPHASTDFEQLGGQGFDLG